jgi:hypothetical protein
MGSAPLCKEVPAEQLTDVQASFRGLQNKLCERLESFANVEVLSRGGGEDDIGIRLGVRNWQPSFVEDALKPGNWLFCEFLDPVVFRFHLPKKLQDSAWPNPFGQASAEDFTVAYDGMVYVGVAEVPEHSNTFVIGPTVRTYLQSQLLASVTGYTAGIIPPSPLHLDIVLRPARSEAEEPSESSSVRFEKRGTRIVITRADRADGDTVRLLRTLFTDIVFDLRIFYHLMIELSVLDEIQDEILTESESAYESYQNLLQAKPWQLIQKLRLRSATSQGIGNVHHSFCQHYLAFAHFQEARTKFLNRLRTADLLGRAEEYFQDYTKRQDMDYSVFRNNLADMRSQLQVKAQNTYLLYAAILGSLITLLGTVVGFMLHKPSPP